MDTEKLERAIRDLAASKRKLREAKDALEKARERFAEAQTIFGVNDTLVGNLLSDAIEELAGGEGV